jgi:hypothetical protein
MVDIRVQGVKGSIDQVKFLEIDSEYLNPRTLESSNPIDDIAMAL